METPDEFPIFPLPAVLFPGTFLPLQVNEEGYRDILRHCVDAGQFLGVVLSPGEANCGRMGVPCTTGCLASVAMLLQADDDTEPESVMLYGERRMRVLDFVQQDPYLTGHIEFMDEVVGAGAKRSSRQAGTLFAQYLNLIHQHYNGAESISPLPIETVIASYFLDPTLASYFLAWILDFPLDTKQRLLESASTAHRLAEELDFLATECERLHTCQTISRHDHRTYSPRTFDLDSVYFSQN